MTIARVIEHFHVLIMCVCLGVRIYVRERVAHVVKCVCAFV